MHLCHILNIQMQLDLFLACHRALSLPVLVPRLAATLYVSVCVCVNSKEACIYNSCNRGKRLNSIPFIMFWYLGGLIFLPLLLFQGFPSYCNMLLISFVRIPLTLCQDNWCFYEVESSCPKTRNVLYIEDSLVFYLFKTTFRSILKLSSWSLSSLFMNILPCLFLLW